MGGAQTRSCAWAKRTSRIWSHYACITADRQSKHGISRVLIPRGPDGLELLQQPGAGTDGDCAGLCDVEPRKLFSQLASFFVVIAGERKDLPATNLLAVLQNPRLASDAEISQEIESVIRLH